MQLSALVPILIFVVIAGVVAVRLLMLGLRTREIPELSISSAILSICLLGMPLSTTGRMPSNYGTPLGDGIFSIGILITAIGIWLFYVFNWSVFRRDHAWAKGAIGLAAGALLFIVFSMIRLCSAAPSLEALQPVIRPWSLSIVFMMVIAFSWSAAESFLLWLQCRRRLQIGLADPVTTNRFLLWGLAGLSTALLCVSIIGFLMTGVIILRDPRPLTMMAVMGSVMSAAWYLSFLAPAPYRRWITARAKHRYPNLDFVD